MLNADLIKSLSPDYDSMLKAVFDEHKDVHLEYWGDGIPLCMLPFDEGAMVDAVNKAGGLRSVLSVGALNIAPLFPHIWLVCREQYPKFYVIIRNVLSQEPTHMH